MLQQGSSTTSPAAPLPAASLPPAGRRRTSLAGPGPGPGGLAIPGPRRLSVIPSNPDLLAEEDEETTASPLPLPPPPIMRRAPTMATTNNTGGGGGGLARAMSTQYAPPQTRRTSTNDHALLAGAGAGASSPGMSLAAGPTEPAYSWDDLVSGRPIPATSGRGTGSTALANGGGGGGTGQAALGIPRNTSKNFARNLSVSIGGGTGGGMAGASPAGGGGAMTPRFSTCLPGTLFAPPAVAVTATAGPGGDDQSTSSPNAHLSATPGAGYWRNQFPKKLLRASDMRKRQVAVAAVPVSTALAFPLDLDASLAAERAAALSRGSTGGNPFAHLVPLADAVRRVHQLTGTRRRSGGSGGERAAVTRSGGSDGGAGEEGERLTSSSRRHQVGSNGLRLSKSPLAAGGGGGTGALPSATSTTASMQHLATTAAHHATRSPASTGSGGRSSGSRTLSRLRAQALAPSWKHLRSAGPAARAAVGHLDALAVSTETEEEYRFAFQNAARMERSIVDTEVQLGRDARRIEVASRHRGGKGQQQTPGSRNGTLSAPGTANAAGLGDLDDDGEDQQPHATQVMLDRSGRRFKRVAATTPVSEQLHRMLSLGGGL
ncbi:hypothetical protein H9P43_007223 [Blastocladiella emersonii ATCC 22665]|nr:hypothetical protein H9P43_007223 [Blastocladiella emersonii ATCC 22665]